MVLESIGPELDIKLRTQQVGANAFGSRAMGMFDWPVLIARISAGGTDIKTAFLEDATNSWTGS